MSSSARGWPRRLRRLTLLPILAVPNLPSAGAWAQSTPVLEEVVSCAAIDDDDTRLACYDRAIERLIGPAGVEGETDAAHEFVGEGDWTSDIVEMRRPWRIAWNSTGSLLTIELRTADNVFFSLAVAQFAEGEGRTDQFEPGSYRVNVRARGGEWRLLLIEE